MINDQLLIREEHVSAAQGPQRSKVTGEAQRDKFSDGGDSLLIEPQQNLTQNLTQNQILVS